MRLRPLATVALLLASACGGPASLPSEDLLLHVALGAEEVAPGEGFPVTVVRVWAKDLEPSAWDERALSPLVLRLEESVRREDDRRIEETRRYRGYAFALKDLTVPPAKLTARPRSGGPERTTSSPRLRLCVKPTLQASAPGAPEPPGEPLAEPSPRWPWFAGGALALLAAGLWFFARRPRATPPPAAAEPRARPAHEEALEALARVAARNPETYDALRTDVAEVAEVLRGYVAARWGVRTRERTSEEVLRSLTPVLDPAACARLTPLFVLADEVKFGAHVPTPGQHAGMLEDATAWVAATGSA